MFAPSLPFWALHSASLCVVDLCSEYHFDVVDRSCLLFVQLGSKSDRNDEWTLRWLTNDGLQRLTQSRCETSSCNTDDDLDDSGSVEKGIRWANKSLWYDEVQRVQMRV